MTDAIFDRLAKLGVCWVDEAHMMHMNVPAVVRFLGFEDSPANREAACRSMIAFIREHYPAAKIVAVQRDGRQN